VEGLDVVLRAASGGGLESAGEGGSVPIPHRTYETVCLAATVKGKN
jgi:hypothetical protein